MGRDTDTSMYFFCLGNAFIGGVEPIDSLKYMVTATITVTVNWSICCRFLEIYSPPNAFMAMLYRL